MTWENLIVLFAGFGALFIVVLGVILGVELLLRLKRFVVRNVLTKPVTRKDFIDEGYHNYLNWIEDWQKPMFMYCPIGFRLFNTDNPISPVKNNSLGFRCEEFSSLDEDALRIVILGGSAAWGGGASSNETTIAGHLERLINSDKKLLGSRSRAICYNLAQVNAYQTQDILSLVFFARKLRPHLVISYTGWNELIANNLMHKDYLEKYGVFYISEMQGWEPLEVIGNKTKLLKRAISLWGRQHTELFNLFCKARAQNIGLNNWVERISLGSRLFVDHLKILESLTEAFRSRHFQFLQPYVHRKYDLTEQEAKLVRFYDYFRPAQGGKELGDYLRTHDIYQEVLNMIQAENLTTTSPVTDLCDLFRSESGQMFYTLVHLTDAGYLKVAERIYATILSSGSAEAIVK